MKEKGGLVKYFTTHSRDNGGLLLNCTWLDPWVTAKMLRLLFAPAIRSIVDGALALKAAAAARTLLRQSQEEAEVQDAVEDEQEKWDVERAAQRKETNRIPKKKKKVLTEEEEEEAHAIRHQKRDRQKDEQKRDRQEQKARLKAEQAQKAHLKAEQAQKARLKAEQGTSSWPGGWIFGSSAESQVRKDHDDVVDGVQDTSDIDVEDEDGAECNAVENIGVNSEVSELCKGLNTKLCDWVKEVHSTLTNLHPVPRGRVLTALVAELEKLTNDLPSVTNIDEALPRVIGQMHQHIKYVRIKLNQKQVTKLRKLGGFDNGEPVHLHPYPNPTTSRLHLATEIPLTEPSLMQTPESHAFWQNTLCRRMVQISVRATDEEGGVQAEAEAQARRRGAGAESTAQKTRRRQAKRKDGETDGVGLYGHSTRNWHREEDRGGQPTAQHSRRSNTRLLYHRQSGAVLLPPAHSRRTDGQVGSLAI
jgi:hypothetical protein